MIVIAFCSFAAISIAVLASLEWLPINFLQNFAVTLTGAVLTVLGISGMFYCRHYLGRFWTAETQVSQDHQIVDTGPYSVVRHPIYTFAILMYLGFGMVFLSTWNTLLVSIIIAAYILKTKDEDIFLAKKLAGYREYELRVRYRLVPGLW